MNVGDVILLSLRDFQEGKGDIILKYTADEARSLKSLGELPENGTWLELIDLVLTSLHSHYQ